MIGERRRSIFNIKIMHFKIRISKKGEFDKDPLQVMNLLKFPIRRPEAVNSIKQNIRVDSALAFRTYGFTSADMGLTNIFRSLNIASVLHIELHVEVSKVPICSSLKSMPRLSQVVNMLT